MNKTSFYYIVSYLITIPLLLSCSAHSSSSTTSAYDAGKPSAIIGVVKTAVSKIGTGVSTSSIMRNKSRSAIFTASMCDTHGDPKDGTSSMSTSNPSYPGTLTYCKMDVNDGSPDTVAGAFETPRGISCAVERAGITFDGQPHAVSITLDTNCFTQTQLDNMGVSSAIEATVTASKPASFNSYFDAGIRIQVTSLSVDYQLGTKVTDNSIEFVSIEGSGTSKSGAFAGSFNTLTGDLRYEGRMNRINCTENSSCGWNRHIRAFANLNVDSSGNPTSLNSISFGYANISSPPGQNSYSGVVVTAKGSPSTGIKARAWNATNGSSGQPTAIAQYDTVGNWTEVSNTYCYTHNSSSATGCDTGIELFSGNTNFLLNAATHTTSATFANNYAGMTFTSVNLSSDLP